MRCDSAGVRTPQISPNTGPTAKPDNRTGICIGRKTLPADVRIVSNEEDKSVLEIVLYEGRNRQIRRLCEEAGLDTVRLKRIAVGQLKLSGLKVGEYRPLTKDEVSLLKRQSGNY